MRLQEVQKKKNDFQTLTFLTMENIKNLILIAST